MCPSVGRGNRQANHNQASCWGETDHNRIGMLMCYDTAAAVRNIEGAIAGFVRRYVQVLLSFVPVKAIQQPGYIINNTGCSPRVHTTPTSDERSNDRVDSEDSPLGCHPHERPHQVRLGFAFVHHKLAGAPRLDILGRQGSARHAQIVRAVLRGYGIEIEVSVSEVVASRLRHSALVFMVAECVGLAP